MAFYHMKCCYCILAERQTIVRELANWTFLKMRPHNNTGGILFSRIVCSMHAMLEYATELQRNI